MNKENNKQNYVYIEKLAYDFGLYELPKKEQKLILTELTDAFEQRLLIKLMEKLKAKQRNDLEKMINSDKELAIFDYLVENIPNLMTVLDQVYLDMRKELLTDVKI